MERKQIKQDAKRALRGQYVPSIAVLLIVLTPFLLWLFVGQILYALTDGVASGGFWSEVIPPAISLLTTALGWLLLLPLFFGVCRYFFYFVRDGRADVSQVFAYFTSFRRYVKTVWGFNSGFAACFGCSCSPFPPP